MSKRKWTDRDFILAVSESLSYAQVIRKLGLRVAGSNYEMVKRKIREFNLDISHFTGQGWNNGKNYIPIRIAQPIEKILIEHSTFINANHLRNRLLNEHIKEYKCEKCNNSSWLGQPIPLELHHINGIKDDQRIENLQLLCPNCHALTDNYRGKNKKKY